MFPKFIPSSLINFWLFFVFLSLLPLIMALITQKRDDKKGDENK